MNTVNIDKCSPDSENKTRVNKGRRYNYFVQKEKKKKKIIFTLFVLVLLRYFDMLVNNKNIAPKIINRCLYYN